MLLLLVDDSATLRKMVKAALKPLGFDFGEAANGLEAVEQLALRDYDGMILDMNMPDMHGLEVIQYARAYEQYQDLPIMVLSTRSEEETQEQALEAGANMYRTKPFKIDELQAAVRKLLSV